MAQKVTWVFKNYGLQKYIDSKLDRVGIWLNLKEKSQAFGLGN